MEVFDISYCYHGNNEKTLPHLMECLGACPFLKELRLAGWGLVKGSIDSLCRYASANLSRKRNRNLLQTAVAVQCSVKTLLALELQSGCVSNSTVRGFAIQFHICFAIALTNWCFVTSLDHLSRCCQSGSFLFLFFILFIHILLPCLSMPECL